MITVIVKKGKPRGLTRTGMDRRLIDAGWGSTFKNEEEKDKCAFVERKLKENHNMDDSRVTARLFKSVK